jgi:hypothetical protein
MKNIAKHLDKLAATLEARAKTEFTEYHQYDDADADLARYSPKHQVFALATAHADAATELRTAANAVRRGEYPNERVLISFNRMVRTEAAQRAAFIAAQKSAAFEERAKAAIEAEKAAVSALREASRLSNYACEDFPPIAGADKIAAADIRGQ